MATSFGILGLLEVHADGRPLAVSAPKQRTVLALLLCRANSVVSVAELTDAVWGDEVPRTAHKNLQVYVSGLRKLIGSAPDVRLVLQPPGYMLRLEPHALDALRLRDLAAAGRAALRGGDVAAAVARLEEAKRLWRGPVLPDLVSAPGIAAEADRLTERYLAVYEDWAEAKLAAGRPEDLVDGVGEMARRHPLRQRLRHAQMLALYRSGLQSEALAEYDSLRQLLSRELGLEPGPVLQRLARDILAGTRDAAGPAGRAAVRDPAPDRLPRDVADLTGRGQETATLMDWLGAGSGTVAISGPVGVGKTALAVHHAHRLGERSGGACMFVALRGPDGTARAARDVIAELGHRRAHAGTPPDRRRPLVILDDAVAEEQVRPILAAVGDATVLVTGRRHLGGLEGARHLALDRLSEEDGVRLLTDLLGAPRVTADPAGARRLTALCGGLPLALRVVAAKLGVLRHLDLAQYAERLADERRMLAELAAGGLGVRPRLEAAYRDLDREEQAAVVSLGQLPEADFTAPRAAGALGLDALAAEATVERLIEAGLVEAHMPAVVAHDARRPGVLYRLVPLMRALVRSRGR